MANPEDQLNESNDALSDFQRLLASITEGVTTLGNKINTDIKDQIVEATSEGATLAKVFGSDINKSVNRVKTAIEQQQGLQAKLQKGALKQADIEKQRTNQESLRNTILAKIEAAKGAGVRIDAEAIKNLEGQLYLLDSSLETLEDEYFIQKQQKGITGEILDNLREKAQEYLNAANATDLLNIALGATAKQAAALDTSAAETARALGLSYDQAVGMIPPFHDIAESSDSIYVTTLGIDKTFSSINSQLGFMANLSDEVLVTYTKFTEQAKFSDEANMALFKTAQLTGKTLEENTQEFFQQVKAIELQTGQAVNSRQVLEQIGKTSAATRLTLGNSTQEIARAAVEAQKLGIEIEGIQKISESLLDFESSISAELEAELLTGKQLNLERARYAALNGDIATVASEISKQLGSAEEFGRMNVIQQEAFAKSLGLSRDEVAGMLEQQELLNGTQFKSVEEAQEQLKLAREQGREAEFLREVGNEELQRQLQTQSIQERLVVLGGKLVDAVTPLADLAIKILEPFANLAEKVLPAITKYLDVAVVGLGSYLAITKTIYLWKKRDALISAATAAINAAKSASLTPIIGPALAAAAAAGVYALSQRYLKKGDDVISPGYGQRVLSLPEGDIALNDNDTIVAGTDLNQGGGGGGASMEMLKETNALLRQLIAKEGVVMLDSTKVGTAMAIGTYKTQ